MIIYQVENMTEEELLRQEFDYMISPTPDIPG
jgi:hypothetical protein